MKKIRITEKQASLLGIQSIKENEESGLKSVGASVGDVVVRIVISGANVPKFKERILQLVARQDNDARVGFFEGTGKIVGNVKEIRLDSIKRDIKSLDPSILVEKKPVVKSLKEGKVVKITKEQYDRIFGGKLIKENAEKPKEGEDPFKSEIIELIKYLYRKSEHLSSFWGQNGITYEQLCEHLLSKGMIVSKNGKYELSKKLGTNPQEAIQGFENELRKLVKPKAEETPIETGPEMETEASNIPAGAENDSAAPFNQKQQTTSPIIPKQKKLEIIALNKEIALFKGPDGSIYVFNYEDLNKKDLMDYAEVTRHYVGRADNGEPQFDFDNDFEIDADVISNYVNDNIANLSKGEGRDAFESGVNIVKVDELLKQELAALYDKDKSIAQILGPIEEVDIPTALNGFKDNVKQAFTPTEKPAIPQSKIVAKLAELKAKEEARRNAEKTGDVDEMTGTASAGAFTPPMSTNIVDKKPLATPIVAELTVAGAGNFQYDTPGLANIGRNGEFKKGSKTKAEKTPQWAGGSFVKQPECAKLNNNKSAENGGCNQGPSSLKTVKTSGSINAPSLGENEIYEAIAIKTGKTIDEVKRIIESKKIKG